MINAKYYCSCKGFIYRGKCKHINDLNNYNEAKKVFHSPQEKSKYQKEASKYGKQIAPIVSKNDAYLSPEDKIKNNKDLQNFLIQVDETRPF